MRFSFCFIIIGLYVIKSSEKKVSTYIYKIIS